jgi:hypothetical protein
LIRFLLPLGLVAVVVVVMPLVLTEAWLVGVLVQPGGGWWLVGQDPEARQQAERRGQLTVPAPLTGVLPGTSPLLSPVVVPPGMVSDVDRARLTLAAGWSGEDAVTALAVSFAEDPTGDPLAFSSTGDLCLWQINLAAHPNYSRDFLSNPQNCADAGHTLWASSGWGIWCTYDSGCGIPHVGQYRSFLDRARAALGLLSPPASPVLTGGYAFPLPGIQPAVNLHWGVAMGGSDLFAPRGQPVVAVGSGTVLESGYDTIGGNAVLIRGNDGLLYYYAHFNTAPLVTVGQQVQAGQQIGVVGNTGDASGGPTHLHIGIGYSILLGADATGGTGSGFDAVSFLRRLEQGGS